MGLQQPTLAKENVSRGVFLASTIGPVDSGIIALLEDEFEKETGIRVRHVAAGTSAALKIAEQGSFDLVIAHAKELEEDFVANGFGVKRYPMMYNDFVIVGPADDPAGIRGMAKATLALKKIADARVKFVSRGDKSGTNVAEVKLWGKAGINPHGNWYDIYEKGASGNTATLLYANSINGYTFIDRSTYLACKDKMQIGILVESDEDLLNYISVIPVNPKKFIKINYAGAMKFIHWMNSPSKGQMLIRDFGKDKYQTPLFFPNSNEWNKKKQERQVKGYD